MTRIPFALILLVLVVAATSAGQLLWGDSIIWGN